MMIHETLYRLPVDFRFRGPDRTQSIKPLIYASTQDWCRPSPVLENLWNHSHTYASQESEVR